MIICAHCSTVNHPDNVVCSHCGSALQPDPALDGDPFVGRTLGGRFVLESIVGSGEIGMVYRGTDQRSGTTVAVKIVHPDVAATHGDELLRTARELARLRHAKVATVLGAARSSDGTTFIVTEFIQGQTLRTLLDGTGPLGAHRAADILFQICSALAPIHRAGRPHCNLKPENVFLVERADGSDFVKIVDAGSPSLFGVKETAGGELIIGTPKYFSPEQALGRAVGLASDQFTVGVIGYQLLTGALPFFGATPDQLLSAIANGQPTPVNQRAGSTNVPQTLEAVIDRCMAKDPNRRFPDLRSIATDLAAVIKSTQAAPKRKTFGAGRNLSTVVAGPELMAQLSVEDDDDDEATALRQMPVDIEALLRSSAPAPAMASDPLAAPEPQQSIPEPLMFTGAISQDELQAQLQQARPRGPSFADNDLSAAMAAAAAEAEGRALQPPPPEALPQQPPPPEKEFDPFGDMELPPAAPMERPSGNPVPSPELSNAIFDAISEELHTTPQPVKPAAAAAAPLATAADFAALSPDVITRAKDVQAAVEASKPIGGGGSSAAVYGLVAVLLLGLVGGAVWWFVLREPEAPAISHVRPKPQPKAPVAPKTAAAPTSLARPVTAKITSTPSGAKVMLGEKLLGLTPLQVTVDDVKPQIWTLTLDGHEPAAHTFDATQASADAPVPVEITLTPKKKGAEPPKPKQVTRRPTKKPNGGGKVTRPSTRPKKAPARRRKPKTDPSKLKDPFG